MFSDSFYDSFMLSVIRYQLLFNKKKDTVQKKAFNLNKPYVFVFPCNFVNTICLGFTAIFYHNHEQTI